MSEKLDAEGFYASSLCKVDPDGKPYSGANKQVTGG
jgi:hypothetical protein